MGCKIIFTAGAKGGTGKTTALCHIASWLKDNGINPWLMDADDENRSLTRFFPEAVALTAREPIDNDRIVDEAASGRHALMLVDLKAGANLNMLDWFRRTVPFAELNEMGVTFTCVGVITSSPDSVQSFLNWVHAIGKSANYLVVKNEKDGARFDDYTDTKEAREFQKNYRPKHVTLERLHEKLQTELDRLSLLPSDVVNKRKPGGPVFENVMGPARLRTYLQGIYDQLDAAKEVLLPA